MARRGNNEGSISRRKDGRWYARISVPSAGGGTKQKSIYGKTRAECAKKLNKALADLAGGIVYDAKGETVGEFMERWLDAVVKPNKTHRTYATHRQQIRSHIIPTIGRVKLDALRKVHVDRLYAYLLRPKSADGAELAPSSVRRVHAVLHAALEEAVRGDLIPRNPARYATKPKVRQKEIEPLDAEQALKLLDKAYETRDKFEALYVLCLLCALRQGEALGLKWSDIDLESGSLYVVRQLQRVRRDGDKSGTLEFSEPKNASRRKVGLPQRAIIALRNHAERQLVEIEKAGERYEHHGLVFASEIGTPLDAQNIVNRSFKPLLKRAGLPSIRFHDLRHSCLSLLAERGEPLRDLQALAGHASAAFTMQRYTHHYGTSAGRTARAMDDILPEGAPPEASLEPDEALS